MEKFLLVCFILAVLFFIFTGNAHGARSLVEIAMTGAGTNVIRLVHAAALSPALAPSQGGMETGANQDPRITRIGLGRRHHFLDKSVAGGDVILGGFAAALAAAIFCYIHVTRKSRDSHGED